MGFLCGGPGARIGEELALYTLRQSPPVRELIFVEMVLLSIVTVSLPFVFVLLLLG